ncbi:MAG: MBL fold metallo-hydrolase, partial [Myxococcota bacterium]
MRRPKRLTLPAWLALALPGACVRPPPPPLPPSLPQPVVSRRLAPEVRVHAMRVGFVQVRPTHYEGEGASLLRTLRIISEGDWSPWLPIIVFAVEHPEGTILVDTGLSRDIALDPETGSPRGGLGWFYENHLRFFLPSGDDLGARLEEVGLGLEDVDQVVLTHLHADHTGNLSRLSQAEVWTGEGNWPSHLGSVWPPGTKPPRLVPDGAVGTSYALTEDGLVRIVRLPGHTQGHIGVSVVGSSCRVLMAGDATFDAAQTDRRGVSGISEDLALARMTQERLRSLPPHTLLL